MERRDLQVEEEVGKGTMFGLLSRGREVMSPSLSPSLALLVEEDDDVIESLLLG